MSYSADMEHIEGDQQQQQHSVACVRFDGINERKMCIYCLST